VPVAQDLESDPGVSVDVGTGEGIGPQPPGVDGGQPGIPHDGLDILKEGVRGNHRQLLSLAHRKVGDAIESRFPLPGFVILRVRGRVVILRVTGIIVGTTAEANGAR
jgi:hypothetical protein